MTTFPRSATKNPFKEGKTPVTVLQELCLKKGFIPNYNLIYDGVGTHEPVFKYEVSAGGKSAVGAGKSKKEAKHNAACKLLQDLKINEFVVADEVASPYEGVLKENAVGDLNDFCLLHNLRTPEYKLTRDEGLPHAKVFSWACTVSSFTTEGTARTKKNAKQIASQEMLLKLKQYLGDIIDSPSSGNSPNASPEREARERQELMDKALDKVIKLIPKSKKKMTATNRLGLNLADVCYSLQDNQYPGLNYLDTLTQLTDSERKNIGDMEEALEKIVEELQVTYDLELVDSVKESQTSYVLEINTVPSWTFMVTADSPEAARQAIFSEAVDFLTDMRR